MNVWSNCEGDLKESEGSSLVEAIRITRFSLSSMRQDRRDLFNFAIKL